MRAAIPISTSSDYGKYKQTSQSALQCIKINKLINKNYSVGILDRLIEHDRLIKHAVQPS
jgi:hypothetical protein